MAFIPVPDTVEVDVNQLCASQIVQNTLYFRRTGGWTLPDMQSLGAGVSNWWADTLADSLTNRISLRDVTVRDLSSAGSFVWVDTTRTGATGAVNEDCVPNNVAFCLKLGTLLAGRSNRGRNYVGGFTKLGVVNSAIAGGFANDLVTAYSELFDVAATAGGVWVIVSRQLDGVPRTVGATQGVESVSYTKLTVSTQRRRLPGSGT